MASMDFNLEELVSPAELKLLGAKETGIFFTQELFGEGDKKNVKEKKKICVSNKRLYILNIHGKPVKLELSLSLLSICELSSPAPDKVTLAYNVDPYSDKAKQVKFEVKGESCVEFLAAILSPLNSTLGKDAVAKKLKVKLTGDGRQEQLDEIVDENVARVSQGCQGGSVSEVYALLCDFFDIPFHDEIAWDLENTYQTHSIRILSLNHFDHFPTRDSVPLIRMLEFCSRFEGISADGIKLCQESFDAFVHISKNCPNLHSLTLKGITGLNHKLAQKLFAQGFASNPNCVLEKVDLTDTLLDEKAIESLTSSIQHNKLGLRELKLSGVGLSSKSFANFSKNFVKHAEISNTLSVIDFSNNHFSSSSSDLQAFLTFLAGNNRIQDLSLASTYIPFEQLFTALQRGCTTHLTSLNISCNSKPAIGKAQTKSTAMKQFFQTAIALKQMNFSNCKLSADFILMTLEGLKENSSLFSLQLNISQNDLSSGQKEIAASLKDISCIESVDLSYTNLDGDYEEVIGRLLKSTSLKHLDISGNIRKLKSSAAKVLEESCSDKGCKLEALKLNDCKLGDSISYLLHGLIRNNHLKRLEISGNLMGSSSIRRLAKLINNNCVLEAIEFDDNLNNVSSLNNLAAALENNYSIQEMPIHFRDIIKLKKENDKEVEVALSKISKLLARNQSPLKREHVLGGIKKRIDLFIAEQQLVLDKKIVELDEEILLYDISNLTNTRKEVISKANNLKAKAGLVTTLCENFYSNKLETEISFHLSELINEQSRTGLLPQVITYREKIFADMFEKLEFSLGDVISKDKIEEIKQNIPASQDKIVVTEDILCTFSDGLASSVNAGNLRMVEALILQTCELVVKELDSMHQQVSNLESTEFPKSPDRNISGGTCRLKLAFSASMKRHRVSYSNFNPQISGDNRSEDLELDKESEPPEDLTVDPVPKIMHTDPSVDVEELHNVSDEAIAEATSDLGTKGSKRFGKPKFMSSLKGKKEEKDKKTKPAKRNDSTSSSKNVKSGSDSVPDIATFDDLSKVAVLAPNLELIKSKPRGPPRRPPRRKEPTPTDIPQTDSDIFTDLTAASVPGFESVPDAVDETSRDDRPSTLDLTDQPELPENAESMPEKVPPPTSPRKPQKPQIGMGPGLASVLQGGLVKARVRASKSHENIFDELANDNPLDKSKDKTVRKADSQPITAVKPKPKQRPDSKIMKIAEDETLDQSANLAEKSEEIPTEEKPKLETIIASPLDETQDNKLEANVVSTDAEINGNTTSPIKDETPVSPEPVKSSEETSPIKESEAIAEGTIPQSEDNKISGEPEAPTAAEVTESASEDSDKAVPEVTENTTEPEDKPEESHVEEKQEDPIPIDPIDNTPDSKEIPKSPDSTEDKIETEAKDTESALKPTMSPPVATRRSTLPPKSPKKSMDFLDAKNLATSKISEEGDVRKSPIVSRKPIISKERLQPETKTTEDVSSDKEKPQPTNRPKPTLKPAQVKPKPKLPNMSPEKTEPTETKEKIEEAEEVPKEDINPPPIEKQGSVPSESNPTDDTSNKTDSQELVYSSEAPTSPPIKAKPTTPVKPKRVSTGAIDGNKPETLSKGKEEASPVQKESKTKETEQSDPSQEAAPTVTAETP
eukprot:TRINITY_DN285_c0_g1_i2.p1 TRINITY_DN285_c0_g1~~TRINITY_DN285_c0_g1_i2.p1  ORF type:complete len:1626 (+),score=422.20 TRINITY_DN285_c0_g1_i2:106-4983(+)